MPKMHPSALLWEDAYGVELWVDTLDAYEKVLPLKEQFETKWASETELTPKWDAHDEDKKSRHVIIKVEADLSATDWDYIYQWLVDWLLKFRELALVANGFFPS
jgi:hypothetical protein